MEEKELSLSSAGNNITKVKSLPPSMMKAAFVVINDENKTDKIKKGTDGRSLDGYHIMKLFRRYGFEPYYLHNPTKEEFLKYFDIFLEKTIGYLVFYYTGNGRIVKDGHSSIVFSDGRSQDNQLLKHIAEKKQESSILLHISDSCFKGSILDFTRKFKIVPPNVISIAAVNDTKEEEESDDEYEEEEEEEEEEEKSCKGKKYCCVHIEKGGQGVFAYHFRKAMTKNTKLTPNDLYSLIINDLERHNEKLSISSSNPELLDQDIFY